MRNTLAQLRVIVCALAVLLLGMVVVAGPASAEGELPDGFYICHATGSETAPEDVRNWVTNYPDDSGQASGHAGEDHQNGLDIIPPIPGVLPEGQNWTEYGQAVHALGCAVPVDPEVSFTDNSCVNGSYVPPSMSAPEYDGLTRRIDGTVAPGNTVTVTYTAKQGYGIVGQSVFPHTFPASPASQLDCDQVIPVTPDVTMVDQCGTANDSGPTFVQENQYWIAEVDGNSVVFTAKSGWKFADGSKTKTVQFTPNTNAACPIPATPEVTTHDECGTANDSGPTFVHENEYWTAEVVGSSVVFTAKAGWTFPNGSNTRTVQFTPNSDDPCTIAVPARQPVDDPCGSGNATWVVPGDTAVLDWTLREDGHLTVTVLTAETVFESTGLATHDFGEAPESNTEPCPIPIETVPVVSMHDECGTLNDTGPTWAADDEKYTGVDDGVENGVGTVTFTAVAPYHFVGENDQALNEVVVEYTPNSSDPCTMVLPADLALIDPCGSGNARWEVPADTTVLDWTLGEDGHLTVAVLTAETVFESTGLATHDFGMAPETNTEPCPTEQPEPLVREVAGAQASCKIKGSRTWTDVYTTEFVWDAEMKDWVPGEETGPVRTDETFTPYGELPDECVDDKGKDPKGEDPKDVEVRGAQQTAAVPTVVDAGLGATDAPGRRSPNGLTLIALGGGLLMIGFAGSRRRTTARR